ncbi:hypothetical protein MTO96_034790 [Rhipicephalus appendiculatus]
MSNVTCAVRGCRHHKWSTKRVSYHGLPADTNRKRLWEEAVGRSLPYHARICSAHFKARDYKPLPLHGTVTRRLLKNTAVPSVFRRTSRSKVLRDILVVPSVENIWVTDDVGANVEVGAAESYKLASCNFASRQRAGTSEVVTQTWDDLNDTIPNVSVLNKPHDEHAYASRWCPPTCIAAGTQVNLYLFESSKKDHGSQTDFDMFGYTGRTLSSYGRRIGYPSHSEHSWPQRGCCCE